jgi:hypothetical protein
MRSRRRVMSRLSLPARSLRRRPASLRNVPDGAGCLVRKRLTWPVLLVMRPAISGIEPIFLPALRERGQGGGRRRHGCDWRHRTDWSHGSDGPDRRVRCDRPGWGYGCYWCDWPDRGRGSHPRAQADQRDKSNRGYRNHTRHRQNWCDGCHRRHGCDRCQQVKLGPTAPRACICRGRTTMWACRYRRSARRAR